jgi:hypothetical protein
MERINGNIQRYIRGRIKIYKELALNTCSSRPKGREREEGGTHHVRFLVRIKISVKTRFPLPWAAIA